MKRTCYYLTIVFVFGFMPLLFNCASQQQEMDDEFAQQEEEEEEQQQQEEQEEEEFAEDENFEEQEDFTNAYQEPDLVPEEGEGINNSVVEEFASEAPQEQPAIDTGASEVVEDAASNQDPQNAGTYTPGGRVKYVVPGGAPIFATNNGATPMGMLTQGDHPVVFDEGEWARTSDGTYIPNALLTHRPINRMEPPAVWR